MIDRELMARARTEPPRRRDSCMKVFGRVSGIVLLVIAWVSPSASAQSSLPDLSFEDLMKLDAGQVFGASDRLQPVTEAPASVTFITAEEIARYGYRTLADILRAVRGMYVTNDRNYSFLGTRGFANPGDYNSRILLLVNGHRVNDNIFGQAEIGAEFGLDPAMFERVEVIRGPASSLYGDSAFLAVVNVITRSGASLNGGSITLETGTLATQLVRVSAGRQLANGLDVALSGTYEKSDGVGRLFFPVFDAPVTNNGVAESLDGESVRQFYGRLTFKGLDVTGAYGSRQRDVPTASLDTVFNQQIWREETTDRHTLVDAQYGRELRGTRLALRASYDRYSYSATYPYDVELDGTPTLVGSGDGLGTRWSVSSGVTRTFRGRQTLRAGVEFIDNVKQAQTAHYIGDPQLVLDTDRSSTQQAAYVQDEIKLGRWVIVMPGFVMTATRSSTGYRHARRSSSCPRPPNRSSTSTAAHFARQTRTS
jgi:outer membrane receptor for ferrienterochelin and colicins